MKKISKNDTNSLQKVIEQWFEDKGWEDIEITDSKFENDKWIFSFIDDDENINWNNSFVCDFELKKYIESSKDFNGEEFNISVNSTKHEIFISVINYTSLTNVKPMTLRKEFKKVIAYAFYYRLAGLALEEDEEKFMKSIEINKSYNRDFVWDLFKKYGYKTDENNSYDNNFWFHDDYYLFVYKDFPKFETFCNNVLNVLENEEDVNNQNEKELNYINEILNCAGQYSINFDNVEKQASKYAILDDKELQDLCLEIINKYYYDFPLHLKSIRFAKISKNTLGLCYSDYIWTDKFDGIYSYGEFVKPQNKRYGNGYCVSYIEISDLLKGVDCTEVVTHELCHAVLNCMGYVDEGHGKLFHDVEKQVEKRGASHFETYVSDDIELVLYQLYYFEEKCGDDAIDCFAQKSKRELMMDIIDNYKENENNETYESILNSLIVDLRTMKYGDIVLKFYFTYKMNNEFKDKCRQIAGNNGFDFGVSSFADLLKKHKKSLQY